MTQRNVVVLSGMGILSILNFIFAVYFNLKMMGGFILGFLNIIAIVVLLIGYLVLFVPILAVDEVKRYPSASILSLVLVYLESLA